MGSQVIGGLEIHFRTVLCRVIHPSFLESPMILRGVHFIGQFPQHFRQVPPPTGHQIFWCVWHLKPGTIQLIHPPENLTNTVDTPKMMGFGKNVSIYGVIFGVSGCENLLRVHIFCKMAKFPSQDSSQHQDGITFL